jgi:hypothetical protein
LLWLLAARKKKQLLLLLRPLRLLLLLLLLRPLKLLLLLLLLTLPHRLLLLLLPHRLLTLLLQLLPSNQSVIGKKPTSGRLFYWLFRLPTFRQGYLNPAHIQLSGKLNPIEPFFLTSDHHLDRIRFDGTA